MAWTLTYVVSVNPKGHDIYKKISVRTDTITVIAMPEREKCPRIDQIRKLSVHDIAAKGPGWARSLTRKILGNEEFCLQIDAHTEFAPEWDEKVKHEWAATGNEFGIISTVPPAIGEADDTSVPRQCWVKFQEIGAPVRSTQRAVLVHLGVIASPEIFFCVGVFSTRRWKSGKFKGTVVVACMECRF